MPRGYRCIVVALGGWLILAGANHADPKRANEQSQAERSIAQSLSNIAADNHKLTERAERPPEREPCGPKQYGSNADLCAQWKAADSASDSAWWAWASGLVGFGSLIGVLIAICLALQSNRIARDAAYRQLRAYVSPSKCTVRLYEDEVHGLCTETIAVLVNTGLTPTTITRVEISTKTSWHEHEGVGFGGDRDSHLSIANPGRKFETWIRTKYIHDGGYKEFDTLMTFISVSYRDYTGRLHNERMRWELLANELDFESAVKAKLRHHAIIDSDGQITG